GPVKADAVLTDEGFKILEMAPRFHGPRGTLWMIPLALGFQPLAAALQVLTGEGLPNNAFKPSLDMKCIYRAILPEPGRVVSISGVEEALKLPGIENIMIFARQGGIIPDYRNSSHVPGYVFAIGDSFELAERRLERGISTVKIETCAPGF
ncbi:MAG: hypothetical protein Q8P44_03865, partial [Dehalococcoidia bacterium]|nr:hypothetical protein [Dehalococcoidia bacterium]